MAADGQILIRVGAAADRSVDTVFGGIEKRALRTRDNINKALGGGGQSALAKSFDGVSRAAQRSADSVDKTWNQELARLNRIAKAQDKLFERVEANKVRVAEKAARERVRAEEKAVREVSRVAAAAARQNEREARQAERVRQRFAERTAWRATKFMVPPPMGALGVAHRIAGDLVRGAGVDMSVSGGVQRAIGLQSQAVTLANQERIATGSTAGAAHYASLARTVGDQTFSAPDQVMGLQSGFAAGTGAYSALGEITPQLASMARASGANFGDVGSAAAKVYNQLKDGPDAISKTVEVMRAIVGQAAEGAVDMDQYASQIGRIAAGGFKFEGDRGTSIAKLSALTQLAMERGATSAPDAARATTSFVSTLGKGARLKAFQKAGVQVYTDEKQDTLRDPFEIIKDSFRKTNGNIPELGNMFMDVLGRKGVESLGAVYKGAGGGEAGIAAIDKEFGRYMSKTLTVDTEKQNMADIGSSAEAKAQRFQNNLDRIAESMVSNVLPALEKLGPTIETVASIFAKMVSFSVENPVTAITAAFVAAIARAGVESSIRGAVEALIMGAGGGGARGAVGALRTMPFGAATAGAALGVGLAYEQADSWGKENGGWEGAKSFFGFGKGKGWGFDAVDDMMNQDARAKAEARVAVASPRDGGPGPASQSMDQLLEENRELRAQLSRGIRVTNLNEIQAAGTNGPKVDGAGRQQKAGQ